ncbi:hypothetical protein [Corynebacterium timonense]|uniref:Uncharacterized protein n=1 Tax=Corynebacterium timonense TaxID=441500 RepID=A0A1H1UUQ3_9CORY|nr:hypothetical protein [Corynebacterium timonense]SDS75991.1 hypothetical protein SAMN04488539_2331 [Corynebacterium timonense]
MTVRSIKATEPCAHTVARLDGSITVARTDTSTVLYNLPRDIGELDDKVGKPSWRARLSAALRRAAPEE